MTMNFSPTFHSGDFAALTSDLHRAQILSDLRLLTRVGSERSPWRLNPLNMALANSVNDLLAATRAPAPGPHLVLAQHDGAWLRDAGAATPLEAIKMWEDQAKDGLTEQDALRLVMGAEAVLAFAAGQMDRFGALTITSDNGTQCVVIPSEYRAPGAGAQKTDLTVIPFDEQAAWSVDAQTNTITMPLQVLTTPISYAKRFSPFGPGRFTLRDRTGQTLTLLVTECGDDLCHEIVDTDAAGVIAAQQAGRVFAGHGLVVAFADPVAPVSLSVKNPHFDLGKNAANTHHGSNTEGAVNPRTVSCLFLGVQDMHRRGDHINAGRFGSVKSVIEKSAGPQANGVHVGVSMAALYIGHDRKTPFLCSHNEISVEQKKMLAVHELLSDVATRARALAKDNLNVAAFEVVLSRELARWSQAITPAAQNLWATRELVCMSEATPSAGAVVDLALVDQLRRHLQKAPPTLASSYINLLAASGYDFTPSLSVADTALAGATARDVNDLANAMTSRGMIAALLRALSV